MIYNVCVINRFLPDIIKSIWQLENINAKIRRQKCLYCLIMYNIYIYIYIIRVKRFPNIDRELISVVPVRLRKTIRSSNNVFFILFSKKELF